MTNHPASAVPIAQIRLALDDAPGEGQPHPAHDISAAARIGDTLFLGADECADLEVLDLVGEDFAAHRRIRLGEAFDLPGGPDEEMDIEGLAVDAGWLWVTGSHSLTRKKPKKSKPLDDHGLARLAHLKQRPNRMFLGRLPLIETSQGRWDVALAPLPDGRRPQMLPIGKHGSDLYKALKKHPLLGPFCALPAKENGLDVEGLVVDGDRVGLGLRGPVINGWALIVEAHIAPASETPDEADLALAGDLKLHVLDLAGLGVRDLKRRAADVLILAGPTMKLSGPARVYRWPGWTTPVPADLLHRPEAVIELPHGQGADHPEALAPVRHGGNEALLVVCDTPSPERLAGGAVVADVFGVEG
ncbi:DUF3616 domain-containing protein [Phenylobacterium sp.]|jgi:hypothetical protein|uniref:DUF3616 domain-containing protein n=1 Tax=Phenylobacterium sp. TaxID=1871053 RepID=UPI002E34100D|nr:DUF3616 domain-containing protein [Phenylobacterium sp.]HEX2559644.1 DUF3616 domain-containing protein [Phenylobacterium sp.]